MSEKQKEYGSGSGTVRCYIVEARTRLDRPQMLTSGEMLDGKWRPIRLAPSPIGVRVQLWSRMAESEGYLDFAAANALAWWFMSNAQEQSPSGMIVRAVGLETRLAAVEFVYSFSATERGVGAVMTEHDERDMKIQPREGSAVAVSERTS